MTFSLVSNSFTRPADTTAYASGDLVANSTTAGSVVPLEFQVPIGNGRGCLVKQMRLQKSGTSVTNAAFIVRLYGSSPTVANGDNGAISSNLSDFLGSASLSTMTAFTDGAKSVDTLGEDASESALIHVVAAGDNGKIYALLSATGAYTPASAEVFTLELVLEQ